MADEYSNISNKEQLTFCYRWIDDHLSVHGDFLGFFELRNIKSDSIVMQAAKIKSAGRSGLLSTTSRPGMQESRPGMQERRPGMQERRPGMQESRPGIIDIQA